MSKTKHKLLQGIVSDDRVRSHHEVVDRALRIAGGLNDLGVSPGDSVGILMRNDITAIEVVQGAMLVGAYATPVNWHFSAEEINHVIMDSNAKVLVVHADLLPRVPDNTLDGLFVLLVPTPPEIWVNYTIEMEERAIASH